MRHLASVVATALLLITLADAFETMILPRTVTRRLRLTRLFYIVAGRANRLLYRLNPSPALRETQLNAYAPLSLIGLIGCWAGILIFAFALLYWGIETQMSGRLASVDMPTALYFSGVTFFTLGFGDITAQNGAGRALSVLEAGVGFGVLAIVISYLPALYQSFSRREVTICMLDARAGSPPTAAELLRRHLQYNNMGELITLLKEYEHWAAELLESYLSYPILAFYRSQHEKQSWLSAIAAILDVCALCRLIEDASPQCKSLRWQAYLTFAMARHTLIDLALILFLEPEAPPADRLPQTDWLRLQEALQAYGIALEPEQNSYARLTRMRQQYEPYLHALGQSLLLEIPPWIAKEASVDNWQTSAWETDGHLRR